MASSQRKSEFLGMPHGTAMHRLRKLVLFQLLLRTGGNVCFRCAQIIQSADELSLEHKEPWEGRDVALFWDMDNIAFSHIFCNRPHTQISARRVIDGKLWCPKCQSFLPVEKFGLLQNSATGYSHACFECHRKRHAKMDRSRCTGCGAHRSEKKFAAGKRKCPDCYRLWLVNTGKISAET